MIHVVVGGCLSGKSELVKRWYLGDGPYRIITVSSRITTTAGSKGVALGRYGDNSRGGGVDYLQHQKGGRLLHHIYEWLKENQAHYDVLAMEGNALHTPWFFDRLLEFPVHLIYLETSVQTLRDRVESGDYDFTWILPTYHRAARIFNQYRGRMSHEIVSGQDAVNRRVSKLPAPRR